jgi:hypothetical protein
MTNTDIIGGVSPLKAWKGRRGKSSGKGRRGTGDTRYKRDKWQKPASGGTTIPKRKAGELPPPPQKPYKIVDGKVEPNVINNSYYNTINQTQNNTPGSKKVIKKTPGVDKVVKTKKGGRLPTFDEAWAQNLNGINSIYKNKRAYKDDMLGIKPGDKRWIEREKARKEAEKETEVVVQDAIPASEEIIETILPSEGGTQIAKIENNPVGKMLGSPGKYRLGGYKAMKKNRK